jgi:hypothetical protein
MGQDKWIYFTDEVIGCQLYVLQAVKPVPELRWELSTVFLARPSLMFFSKYLLKLRAVELIRD